jgi:hypothetical protein
MITRQITRDDIDLEALIKALEDDIESIGYVCDKVHQLDGVALPKALSDIQTFLKEQTRAFTFESSFNQTSTPFKRPVTFKLHNGMKDTIIHSIRGGVLVDRLIY